MGGGGVMASGREGQDRWRWAPEGRQQNANGDLDGQLPH